jgi:hypothetical protein
MPASQQPAGVQGGRAAQRSEAQCRQPDSHGVYSYHSGEVIQRQPSPPRLLLNCSSERKRMAEEERASMARAGGGDSGST